jgi:hypothetical protein
MTTSTASCSWRSWRRADVSAAAQGRWWRAPTLIRRWRIANLTRRRRSADGRGRRHSRRKAPRPSRVEEAAGGRSSRAVAPLLPTGPVSPRGRGPPPFARERWWRSRGTARTAGKGGRGEEERDFDFQIWSTRTGKNRNAREVSVKHDYNWQRVILYAPEGVKKVPNCVTITGFLKGWLPSIQKSVS